MTANPTHLIVKTDALRLGMFVQLDLGWMSHPFPRNRFRLDDLSQIQTLRDLGVQQVLVLKEKSDPGVFEADAPAEPPVRTAEHEARPAAASGAAARPVYPAEPVVRAPGSTLGQRRALLAAQRESLAQSERLHAQASRAWLGVMRDAPNHPAAAYAAARSLANGLVDELLGDEDTTVRVLTEAAGTPGSQHALNVSVLSLMLGRSLGLDEATMQALALGALMHDMGKLMLPDHLRNADTANGALALRERHEHVAQGVRLGMAMGMDPQALLVVAQHHELQNGTGLPQGLSGDMITLPARLVALVNCYDRLCNPRPGSPVRTPHEAQAHLYAQMRKQLDPTALAAFIKLLGVYPPGSVVQLSDDRIAIVVSVDPRHPLKPAVVVHDPKVARDDALILHLHREGGLGVRRSLHPQHLPRAVTDYLSPRERVSYYFAHGLDPSPAQAESA